jgi:hypothetical protein
MTSVVKPTKPNIQKSEEKSSRVTSCEQQLFTSPSTSFWHAIASLRSGCNLIGCLFCMAQWEHTLRFSFTGLMRLIPAPVADSPESLLEHTNVSSPNTKIGLYYFLSSSSMLSGRSDALFWTQSEAGVHLRAKTRYMSFDVRVLLNGA